MRKKVFLSILLLVLALFTSVRLSSPVLADGAEASPSEKPVTGDTQKIWQTLLLGSSLIVAGTLWLGKKGYEQC